jgi:4-amino-4-deoxy-L-arabinose transferase-like glycosyltransferase
MPLLTRAFSQFQVAALGLVLLTIATRLPALVHPQPIDDEAMYSVVANEIVDGGRPYADAVDRKPPLLFWTYAAVFKIAGKFNWKALHVATIVWTLFTMAGLYLIGRRLFDRNTGLIAALLYSVFQPWGTWKNLAFDGELLMNLPIVWAWAIGFRRSSSPLRLELLAAGGLLGAAFLLKQPAASAAVPLGLYLLLPSYRTSRGVSVKASFTHAALLTAGFFAVLGLAALVLQTQGILRDAFYWTVTDHTIPHVFWYRAIVHTLAFMGACLPLVIGAAMACRDDRDLWMENGPERWALLGLLAASAVGAAASARFYPHYYIQLIPPLALLAAPHYARLWSEKTPSQHHWLLQPRVTQAWLALTITAFFIMHWKGLASERQPSETGRYLLEHSAPDTRIFVWGQASQIYLDARRRPACRYITTFPLTGYVFGGSVPGLDTRNRVLPGAWSILQQDFARHPPAYIVESCSDRDKNYPMRDFPILANLVAERYRPIAQTIDSTIYRRLDVSP